MTLYIQVENVKQTIIVPDDTDFTLMIETYYQQQVEWAKAHGRDSSVITKKTPQQILNILCNPELDKYVEFKNHNVQPSSLLADEGKNDSEDFPEHLLMDDSSAASWIEDEEFSELHDKLIDAGITEEQFQLLLRCAQRHPEETLEDIADSMGLEFDCFWSRLKRLRKKVREILN